MYSVNHIVLEFWKWKFSNIEIDKINTLEICNDPTYYLGEEIVFDDEEALIDYTIKIKTDT